MMKILGAISLGFCFSITAMAGVFNTPHFVDPGRFAVGVEPEFTMSDGAGMAANFKYTHGLSEWLNGAFVIGPGGGPRQFRIGGQAVFDIFPDAEGQPGIGVAAQFLHYNLRSGGRNEFGAVPYIHKSFEKEGDQDSFAMEPFFAFPFGVARQWGEGEGFSQVVFGSLFKKSELFYFSVELGVDINHSFTYFSGGVAYYH